MILRTTIAAFLILPVIVWTISVGNVLDYLDSAVPDGQLVYILSKLAGLLALSLLTLQISLMAARHAGVTVSAFAPAGAWRASHHRMLGVLTILCASLHIGLFVAAASLRSDHVTWHLLLPRFANGFYDAMVSLGALGFYALCVAGLIGVYVRRSSMTLPAHKLLVSILSLLVVIHSYAIGSESNTTLMRIYYLILIAILTMSVVSFLRGGRIQPRHAQSRV